MKLLITTLFLLLYVNCSLQAQEKGKLRGGLDLGFAIPASGVGFVGNAELKYNIVEVMNVGFRFGSTIFAKNIELANGNEFESADFVWNTSYGLTFDYYLVLYGSIHPFVGAGGALYSLTNVAGKEGEDYNGNLDFNSKFGGFIRTGFEANRFRLTLEYDFIGKSVLKNAFGEEVGKIENNYFGLTAGFYVGGGRW